MSEKTQALEGNASRAMADALHAGTGNLVDNATRQACDTFVWELTASVIAKVQENLLSETTRLREILHAMPGETICGAANRLVSERDGVQKKYKAARAAWEDEAAKLNGELEDLRDRIESIIFPEVIAAADALLLAVRDGGSMRASADALDHAVAHLRAWPEERPEP